ncbi:NAD(P)/FAD-dependent oxidoreductase [Priestia aryabhattai]
MSIPKIVILGAGYGGILTAQNLQKRLKKGEAEIILVNKNDYHYLTTELHQPAAGTFPFEKTQIFLDQLLNIEKVRFVQDEVIKVHTSEKRVELKNSSVNYDYLVVGLGAEPETFGISGLKEFAFGKWNINAVLELNLHIENKFKRFSESAKAEDLTFVVGGGGFTGVEFISELAYSVPQMCKKYSVDPSNVRLVLVEHHTTILPGFAPELIELATNYLEKKGIEFRLGVGISDCTKDSVTLADGTIINTGTVVWAAGVRGNSVIEKSGFESMRGRVKVDEYLRAPGFQDVFVIGDCSVFIDKETDRPYPPTAQISMQMGARLALNLVSTIRKRGKEKPFKPSIKGTVASIGRKYAVGVVFGKKLQGTPAVIMKKVIDMRYLFTIGGLKLVFKKGRF